MCVCVCVCVSVRRERGGKEGIDEEGKRNEGRYNVHMYT